MVQVSKIINGIDKVDTDTLLTFSREKKLEDIVLNYSNVELGYKLEVTALVMGSWTQETRCQNQ